MLQRLAALAAIDKSPLLAAAVCAAWFLLAASVAWMLISDLVLSGI
jgi:hypothetical protein